MVKFKKTACIVMVFVAAMAFNTAYAIDFTVLGEAITADDYVFIDHFDTYGDYDPAGSTLTPLSTASSAAIRWNEATATTNGVNHRIYPETVDGRSCLAVTRLAADNPDYTDGTVSAPRLSKYIADDGQVYVIDFDIKPSSGEKTQLMFGKSLTLAYFFGSNAFAENYTGYQRFGYVATYQPAEEAESLREHAIGDLNSWMHCTVIADMEHKNVYCYVDGFKISEQSFSEVAPNSATSGYLLQLYCRIKNNGDTVYIDDYTIRRAGGRMLSSATRLFNTQYVPSKESTEIGKYDESVYVTKGVINEYATPQTVTFITAVYNQGAVRKVSVDTQTIEPYEHAFFKKTVDGLMSGDSIKCFLWKDLEYCIPLETSDLYLKAE